MSLTNFQRRQFLKEVGQVSAKAIAGLWVTSTPLLALAQSLTRWPVAQLQNQFQSNEAVIVLPEHSQYESYQTSYNRRTLQRASLRVLARTPEAVSACLKWAANNQVPFSIRGGGHSYEGFSQSQGMVIDTRLMRKLVYDSQSQQVTVGAGIALGEVYKYLSEFGRAIPAGSCPTVGVVGHTVGGGYGLLARKLGLACDSLVSATVVMANGEILCASEFENADLFWGLRGGGNGQLGVVTEMTFQTHPVATVLTFSASWILPIDRAIKVMLAWQSWAPKASSDITSIFKVGKSVSGEISLKVIGQSTGSREELSRSIAGLLAVDSLKNELNISERTFIGAVAYFAGSEGYESVFMKAKSDYVKEPMSEVGVRTLMQELLKLSPGMVVAICDSYGGAINQVSGTATAFCHRGSTLYSIQYYSQWGNAQSTESRLGMIRNLYQAMRPFVSGGSYVNYCDMDLVDFREAYWGDNLSRLQQIKRQYDPQFLFKVKQGICS